MQDEGKIKKRIRIKPTNKKREQQEGKEGKKGEEGRKE